MKCSWKMTGIALVSLMVFLGSFPGAQTAKKLKRAGGIFIRWAFPPLLQKPVPREVNLSPERNISSENYGYRTLEIAFTIDHDPGDSHVFRFKTQLDIGTPALSHTCWFGISTDLYGGGRGISFCRQGTSKLTDIASPPGYPEEKAWAVTTSRMGALVEARFRYDWKKGPYCLRLKAQKEDAGGRWFGLWLIPREGGPLPCGSLRFPADNDGRSPLIIPEGMISSVEHCKEVATAAEIPVFGLFINGVSADEGADRGKPGGYYYDSFTDSWQNNLLTMVKGKFPVHIQIGGMTSHPEKLEE